ncbi:MAG: FecR family protein [Myxococcota bacterium]
MSHELDRLRTLTEVRWSDEDVAASYLRFDRYRIARRRRRRAGASAVVAAVALCAAVVWWPRGDDALHLKDGSTVTWASSEVELDVTSESERLVEIGLRGGAARFQVARNAERLFRVRSSGVSVEVLGTVFSVTDAEQEVTVDVEEGRVRVRYDGAARVLSAGESLTVDVSEPSAPVTETLSDAFPEALDTASGVSAEGAGTSDTKEGRPGDEENAPELSAKAAGRGAGAAPRSWRKAAKRGAFEPAYREMRKQGVRNQAEELLLAADVARMSHHPKDAVAYLRRVVKNHRRDPRAPLAAFTLGKVLLQDLGRPREAARAFADARRLGKGQALAEDALAREIECHYRAGDEERARELADAYLSEYPEGRKRKWVERFGGVSR